MLINNKDLSYFNCKISEFTFDASRNLKIGFIFKYNKEIAYKKMSILIEALKESTLKYGHLNYQVEINDKNKDIKKITSNICILCVEFNILSIHEDEKSITTTKNTTININSPKPCYANLELTASTNVISYTMKINDTEIVVKNIKGNETVYIGSGKVVAGGKSKIKDVDLWEFPQLKQGENKIEVDRADVTLKVKYNERW